MLLKKALSDQTPNFSCVFRPVTYRRYEGVARPVGNLAQTTLKGSKTSSDCASTSRKNSKKNSRCLVSDFFNSIDPTRTLEWVLLAPLSAQASLMATTAWRGYPKKAGTRLTHDRPGAVGLLAGTTARRFRPSIDVNPLRVIRAA